MKAHEISPPVPRRSQLLHFDESMPFISVSCVVEAEGRVGRGRDFIPFILLFIQICISQKAQRERANCIMLCRLCLAKQAQQSKDGSWG